MREDSSTGDVARRDDELAEIRSTYARYRDEGRHRIWDTSNPGFARLVAERDAILVGLLKRSLPESGTVVDVGCGDGLLAQVASDADVPFAFWHGVDLDEEPIARAREAMPWAQWTVASADRLPFTDASVDVVVASGMVSSVPSPALEASIAAEMTRVMRPLGWLVWYDLRYDNPWNRAVHGVSGRRLRELFPGWQHELASTTLLPPLARRIGALPPSAYSFLERIPALRSHLIGRLQKPGR